MTEQPQARRKGGRPRIYASGDKRPTLTFRVRGGLYEKLVASSVLAERSLSEEIEGRLARSYEIEDEFGSGNRLDLIRLIATVMRFTERLTSGEDQRTTLLETKWAVEALLDRQVANMTDGDPENAALIDALLSRQSIGKAGVSVLSAAVFPTGPQPTPEEVMTVLARLLGREPRELAAKIVSSDDQAANA